MPAAVCDISDLSVVSFVSAYAFALLSALLAEVAAYCFAFCSAVPDAVSA
jgi:hypothetical protein